jgi:hypothetical protein
MRAEIADTETGGNKETRKPRLTDNHASHYYWRP